MLLSSHKRIIDVGATDKTSHRELIYAIQAYERHFSDFVLRKLDTDRFEPLRPDERDLWEDLVARIEANLVVPGRSYELLVEHFSPGSTPVAITDLTVDPRALKYARQGVAQYMSIPEMQDLGREIDSVLEGVESRGSTLTVHVNADNELMGKLAILHDRDVAASVATTTCMRAVVQHYGWHAGRQATLSEAAQYRATIEAYLATADEIVELRARDGEMRDRIQTLTDALSRERELNRRREDRRFDAIVGFVDLVDSTRQVIRNPAGAPNEIGQFLKLVLTRLASKLDSIGNVSDFTGDGLQFFFEEPKSGGSNRHVFRTLAQLSESVKDYFEQDEEIRSLVRKVRAEPPRLRVALAFGEVYCSRVVSEQDLIGLPAVEASRLCGMREVFRREECELLLTHESYDRGAEWRLWAATDFVLVESGPVEFSGLEGREVRLYKPRKSQ